MLLCFGKESTLPWLKFTQGGRVSNTTADVGALDISDRGFHNHNSQAADPEVARESESRLMLDQSLKSGEAAGSHEASAERTTLSQGGNR